MVNIDLLESIIIVFIVYDVFENFIGCDGLIIINEMCLYKVRKMIKDFVIKVKLILL